MTSTAWVSVVVDEGGPTGASIQYSLAAEARVTLEIFDVLGARIRTLIADEPQIPGSYDFLWDGLDARGVPVGAGDYLYRLKADAVAQRWKLDLSEEFTMDSHNATGLGV